MRRYEMALVADPTIPEDNHDKQLSAFEQLIADMGGVVQKVERWGRRKMAYPIKKFHEGNYTFILFDSEPSVEKEILRRVKLSDTWIRFLSVRADHVKTPTAEEKALFEQARKDYLQRAQERAAQGLAAPAEDLLVGPVFGAEIKPEEDDFVEGDFGEGAGDEPGGQEDGQ